LPGEASEKAEIPLEEAAVRLEEIRSVAAAAFLLAAGQCAMVHLCSIPRGTAETLITALAAHCKGRINHLVMNSSGHLRFSSQQKLSAFALTK
jgi:hypothetical protein